MAAASDGVPRCGNCHELLPWLVRADSASFEAEIKASVPVLIDFWAPWCGPCKWVEPVIEEATRDNAGRLKVVKVNVDEAPQVATRFEVRGIPTLVVMRDGQEVDPYAGAPSKPDLVAWLEHHLAERVGQLPASRRCRARLLRSARASTPAGSSGALGNGRSRSGERPLGYCRFAWKALAVPGARRVSQRTADVARRRRSGARWV